MLLADISSRKYFTKCNLKCKTLYHNMKLEKCANLLELSDIFVHIDHVGVGKNNKYIDSWLASVMSLILIYKLLNQQLWLYIVKNDINLGWIVIAWILSSLFFIQKKSWIYIYIINLGKLVDQKGKFSNIHECRKEKNMYGVIEVR